MQNKFQDYLLDFKTTGQSYLRNECKLTTDVKVPKFLVLYVYLLWHNFKVSFRLIDIIKLCI
jgi:hypothetical protein